MASSALPSLLLLVVLAISAFSAAARPCKTVFFYTTTTTSFYPIQEANANPKSEVNNKNSPKFLALFFTTVHTPREVHDDHGSPLKFYFPTRPGGGQFSFRSYPFPRFIDEKVVAAEKNQLRPELSARAYDSIARGPISERTRDVLSAVGAMLFGVGCGSLTAATMYLVWSLTSRFGSEEESDDEGFNGEEDDNNSTPKKVGYVAIPDDDEDIAAIKKAAQEQAKIEATGN